MQNLSIERSKRIGKYLLTVISLLVIFVLFLSGTTKSAVEEDRKKGKYQMVEQVTMSRLERAGEPMGVVNEYRFHLGKVTHADILAFFINHHNIRVYVDDKMVYSALEESGHFRTFGGVWAMIPIYMNDSGKEVRVELSPLYSNYQNEEIEFLIGSELEIYQTVFLKTLPELFFSLCVGASGIILLCLAVYFTIRKNMILRLYAVGQLVRRCRESHLSEEYKG